MAKLSIATFYPANPANYDKGRQGNAVDRITVHHTAGMDVSLKALYENPARQGSAHFFVHPDKIEQYVDTNDTAWTNGNYSSNLRAVTIETRGNWQNGYYDQKTLGNLRRLFTELRKLYPNARLTYHKDEALPTKATACPCDLKDKGYALKEWNASQVTNQQGDNEMFTTDAEVKEAYLLLRGNEGSAGERAGWINQPKQNFFKVGKPEADSYRQYTENLKAQNAQLVSERDSLKTALANEQAKPPVEVIKTVEKIVEKPVEVIKKVPVEVIKEVPAQVDEQQVVQNWLVRLWNSLFKR